MAGGCVSINILNRYTGAVLYASATATTEIAVAVSEALKSGADLRSANLRSADLSGANLYGASLSSADLRSANLYGADLRSADLSSADLYGASLYGASLSSADLRSANLYGADLRSADLSSADLYGANLYGADLRSADLYGADLSSADLYGANLYGANLRSADLRSANLYGADLYGANLYGANLRSAKGVSAYSSTPLMMLMDQPGKIRAYKLVTADGFGPFNGGLKYEVGQSVSVDDANTDAGEHCAAGVNVATLDWCIKEWRNGYRILVVEFSTSDIAAIPLATDGKFRLHRCDVVGEKDLAQVGLLKSEEVSA
jgi:uncharacterized protein YjbI with pentapeptide repeats